MMKLLLLSGFAVALAVGPAYAADDASCQAMFEKADQNKDGTVGGPEVTAFQDAFIKAKVGAVDSSSTELIITREQFAEACVKDAFKDVQIPQ